MRIADCHYLVNPLALDSQLAVKYTGLDMTNLPITTDLRQLADGTGMEEHPMLNQAYQMLASGQHPQTVLEHLRNLGGDAEIEALVRLRYRVPNAARRASEIFPEEIITDPLAIFHKTVAVQRERLAALMQRENEGEAGLSAQVDGALVMLQESAAKLAGMMKALGYNPYSKQAPYEERERAPTLQFIINARKEELRAMIAPPVDGEVTEL
jgi:hypothetical protein